MPDRNDAGNASSEAHHSFLRTALLGYLPLAIAVAWCQRDWINADLVSYASVAHRLLEGPASSVTGCWSPLLSWLMVPLLWLGIDDVLAARSVLIAAGACYIAAIHRLGQRLAPNHDGAFVQAALLVCAALQAVLWSGSMVTADLVGNACLFTGMAVLAAPRTLHSAPRALLAGACFGLAYLGKAYLLTFLVPMLPVLLGLLRALANDRSRTERVDGVSIAQWLRTCVLCELAMLAVAAPWIAVLTEHYGRFTFAEVGKTHHANVGPEWQGKDPMWNPPLQLHWVLFFHFEPDWSPLQSWQHFVHQLKLIAGNGSRVLVHMAGWLLLAIVALVRRGRQRGLGAQLPFDGRSRLLLWLCGLWVAVYPLGYVLIDTERRYIIPTLAPMLCLLGLMLWVNVPSQALGKARSAAFGVLIGLLFGWQELRLIAIAAFRHNQMMPRSMAQGLADRMRTAGVADLPFAASDYHSGLGTAYLGHTQDRYFGKPQASDAAARDAELRAAGVRCFVEFPQEGAPPVLPATWHQVAEAANTNGTTTVKPPPRIYVRDD